MKGLVLLALLSLAADWPQFQGPDRSGISSETGLARSWPAEGPLVLWTVPVGEGYGGASVREGRVYLLDREENRQDVFRCLDLADGKELWRYASEAPSGVQYPGSRTMPTVEKEFAYIQSANSLLQCVRLSDHKPVWSRKIITEYRDHRLPKQLQPAPPQWGFTQHPTIAGDRLLVAPHQPGAGLVALDKATGAELWRSADIGLNTFSHVTPYVTTLGGVAQVVTVGNRDSARNPPAVLAGIELATGRTLWSLETWHRYNVPIPQPVRIGPNQLFFTGGYTIGCFVLEVKPATNAASPWTVGYAWRDNLSISSHIHNPLFHAGHIFGQSYDKFHETKHNGLVCLDPAGKVRWKTGPEQFFGNGHLLIADGLLIVMDEIKGELVLAEANVSAYRELARAKVFASTGNNCWSPMSLADGRLLLRSDRELKCLDLRGQKP